MFVFVETKVIPFILFCKLFAKYFQKFLKYFFHHICHMKEITSDFLCNLKEGTFHAIQDQAVFWSIRGLYSFADIEIGMNGFELFIFHHGWAILISWRIVNVLLDTYKRVRDIRKPEWISNVKPILDKDAKKAQGLTKWQSFKSFLKMLFKYFE